MGVPPQDPKTQFEADYPEQAKMLQAEIQPEYERLALKAEEHIQILEKTLAHAFMPHKAQAELEKYAAHIHKQPEVMDYLKQHNPDLSDRVEDLAKTYARHRELDREIER